MYKQVIGCFALCAMLITAAASAQEDDLPAGYMRWDIMFDVPIWPALADLQPVASGTFDGAGVAISGSVHFPVKRFESSDLLFGVDLSVGGTSSSIQGLLADVQARQFYIGGSFKWMLGKKRNLSLDAGLGYHEADISQVSITWLETVEFEHWKAPSLGGFVGVTWDAGAGRPDKSSGLSLGLRVHYTDFGSVYDEDQIGFTPVLGRNAGNLDGPMYVLRIGYSAR